MPRVTGLTPEQIGEDERDWLVRKEAIGLPGLVRIEARQPEMTRARDQLSSAIGRHGTISPRLGELLRLRIAFHNQCRSCMAMRYQPGSVSEDLICSLEQPAEADDLTAAERSALSYADLLAADHLAIDDAVFDDLRRHFTEDEIVELGFRCALAIGFGRLAASWSVTEELPTRFREPPPDAIVTPWGDGEVLEVVKP
jgi:alkylhydroperoxidase family enzyme